MISGVYSLQLTFTDFVDSQAAFIACNLDFERISIVNCEIWENQWFLRKTRRWIKLCIIVRASCEKWVGIGIWPLHGLSLREQYRNFCFVVDSKWFFFLFWIDWLWKNFEFGNRMGIVYVYCVLLMWIRNVINQWMPFKISIEHSIITKFFEMFGKQISVQNNSYQILLLFRFSFGGKWMGVGCFICFFISLFYFFFVSFYFTYHPVRIIGNFSCLVWYPWCDIFRFSLCLHLVDHKLTLNTSS